jgi:hypothetical protein
MRDGEKKKFKRGRNMDQSNAKWRADRIRRLYIEGYGLPWIVRHSQSCTIDEIARYTALPYGVQGPVFPLIEADFVRG